MACKAMTTRLEDPIGSEATAEERHEKHSDRSERLLEHAARIVAKKVLKPADRLQLAEKTWGSVSHTLKAIAASKGWRFHSSNASDSLRSHLRHVSGDQRIGNLYREAYGIHRSFYEDRLGEQDLRDGLEVARELNLRLWAAADKIPDGSPPPHGLVRVTRGRRSIAPREPRSRND